MAESNFKMNPQSKMAEKPRKREAETFSISGDRKNKRPTMELNVGMSFKVAFAAARKKYINNGGQNKDFTFTWNKKKYNVLRGDDTGKTNAEKKKSLKMQIASMKEGGKTPRGGKSPTEKQMKTLLANKGGSVPAAKKMNKGGLNKGLTALKKEAPDAVKNMGYKKGGDMKDYSKKMPHQMNMGGMMPSQERKINPTTGMAMNKGGMTDMRKAGMFYGGMAKKSKMMYGGMAKKK